MQEIRGNDIGMIFSGPDDILKSDIESRNTD